ncbi:hypothetical protein AB0M23_23675 [Streptomyces sp. NPDC052077]|uniref:hypothetical protein n=1 Tax=Streptomyces sp. NPDC052077 TaxID=3154757 RepID=UPI00343B5EA0
MHGPGYPPPTKRPPATGWLVLLRVLFVAVAVFSIGMLAWAAMLRLAIVTRRALDWSLFVGAFLADGVALVLIGREPGDEIHTAAGWSGMALLLGTMVAVIAYYLAADVRHFHRLRHGGPAPAAPAYGYPHPAGPYTGTTVPQTGGHPAVPAPAAPYPPAPAPVSAPAAPRTPPAPHTPVPHTPVPHTPVPSALPQDPFAPPRMTPPAPMAPLAPMPQQPPAAPGAPARIDQVRAELDELSDYLRRHDSADGPREGGR